MAQSWREHRYPDSPRRIRVLRCRRDLGRHGYWLRAPLLPSRHDNPLSRVSTALSTESSAGSPYPWNPLRSNASRSIAGYSKEIPSTPRSWAVSARRQGSANPAPLCAKGQIRRSHPRSRRRRDERPVINPPTGNGPTADEDPTAIPCAGRPRSNPLTRVSTTLSRECQQPCQKPSNCRSETTSANANTTSPPATPERREHRNDTLMRVADTLLTGSTRMIRP